MHPASVFGLTALLAIAAACKLPAATPARDDLLVHTQAAIKCALGEAENIEDGARKALALASIAALQAKSGDVTASGRCEGHVAIAEALLKGPHALDDDGL